MLRTWAADAVNALNDVAETAPAHFVGSKAVRAYNSASTSGWSRNN